jgi:hypothetical protein
MAGKLVSCRLDEFLTFSNYFMINEPQKTKWFLGTVWYIKSLNHKLQTITISKISCKCTRNTHRVFTSIWHKKCSMVLADLELALETISMSTRYTSQNKISCIPQSPCFHRQKMVVRVVSCGRNGHCYWVLGFLLGRSPFLSQFFGYLDCRKKWVLRRERIVQDAHVVINEIPYTSKWLA